MESKTKKYIIVEKGIDFHTIAKNPIGKNLQTISGIYFLRNKINNRIYVGSAINLIRRKIDHNKLLKVGKHPNIFLQNDFRKCNNRCNKIFSFEVKEIVYDKDILLLREQVYLDLFYDNQIKCYNLAPRAGNALGVKWSEKSKEKH